MKTKTLWVVGIVIVLTGIGCMLCAPPPQIRLRVIDVNGKAVAGVDVFWQEPASYFVPGINHALGVTDTDGKVSFQKPSGHALIQAVKGSLVGYMDSDLLSDSREVVLEIQELQKILLPEKAP